MAMATNKLQSLCPSHYSHTLVCGYIRSVQILIHQIIPESIIDLCFQMTPQIYRNPTPPNHAYDYLIKLVIIGDTHTGKGCLLRRFDDDSFTTAFLPTIGTEFGAKTVEIFGIRVKLHIYDTSGAERFRMVTLGYYPAAMGILLVYDITNEQSFLNIRNIWMPVVQEHCSGTVQTILIGNKCDLSDERVVSKKRGQALADEYGMQFFETSVKANTNVTNAFIAIAIAAVEVKWSTIMRDGDAGEPLTLDLKTAADANKRCRCICQ
eukprot:855539_1